MLIISEVISSVKKDMEIIATAVVVVFGPNKLTTFLCREPACTELEDAKAQSNVITSQEIDVTVQQKNSELGT